VSTFYITLIKNLLNIYLWWRQARRLHEIYASSDTKTGMRSENSNFCPELYPYSASTNNLQVWWVKASGFVGRKSPAVSRRSYRRSSGM